MSERIAALKANDVSEIMTALDFFKNDLEEKIPESEIPLHHIAFEAKALLESVEDCENNEDPDLQKDQLMKARVLYHLCMLQAITKKLLPDWTKGD